MNIDFSSSDLLISCQAYKQFFFGHVLVPQAIDEVLFTVNTYPGQYAQIDVVEVTKNCSHDQVADWIDTRIDRHMQIP